MVRFLCLLSVFLSVFSQMYFLKESNVFYANILSLTVIPAFVLIASNHVIKSSYHIKIFIFILFYFIVSTIWSYNIFIKLEDYKYLIYTSIFLICIYNILVRYRTIFPLMLSFWAITFLNFLIFINIIPQEFFIDVINWDSRFYGTFNNPNIGAMSFVISLIFAEYYLQKNKTDSKNGKIFLILIIIISISLIVGAASKKGIILLCIYILYKLIKLNKSNFKTISITVILIFSAAQYIPNTIFNEVLVPSTMRFQKFINETKGQTGVDGSTNERLRFIYLGFSDIIDQPLLGYGYKSFKNKYGEYSHSNYVEMLYSGGILIFIIYYSIYFKLFKITIKHKISTIKSITLLSLTCLLFLDLGAVSYSEKNIQYFICTLFVLNSPDF